MFFFVLRGWVTFCCPKSSGDFFFCLKKLGNSLSLEVVCFFSPKRLSDVFCPEKFSYFFCPMRLGDFFLI